MSRLPKDPLTPASKNQVLVTGIASLLFGVTFLGLATLAIRLTSDSGRILLPSVITLIAVMLVIAVGFLDVAFAALRKKEKRRPYLLSSFTLYGVGGFLVVIPILVFGLSLVKAPEEIVWFDYRALSGVGIGLLAIRLAHIRRKKNTNQEVETTDAVARPPRLT